MAERDETVYTALCKPRLVAGVDGKLVMLNVGLFVEVVWIFGWKFFWWIGVTWLVHQVLKSMTTKDPNMRVIYIVYQRQGDRYVPWVDGSPRRYQRPIGCGRDEPV